MGTTTVMNNEQIVGYRLDHVDLIHEYQCSPSFKELIETENFICVKGILVINFPPYIEPLHGPFPTGLNMTEHAWENIEQCCLRFARIDRNEGEDAIGVSSDAAGLLSNAAGRSPAFKPDEHNLRVFERSKELRCFYDDFVEQHRFASSTSMNFAEEAFAHIKRLKMNKTVFCNKTFLSGRTYDRIKHDRINDPTLETVMAICIGLGLGMGYGESLLAKGGYILSNSPRQIAYKMLLYSYRGHGILECNELLEALNLPSLARKRSKIR
jgi:hypothetical protein